MKPKVPTRQELGMKRILGTGQSDGSLAARTYGEIAEELARRHNIRIGATRVQQICAAAEAKIARALRKQGVQA